MQQVWRASSWQQALLLRWFSRYPDQDQSLKALIEQDIELGYLVSPTMSCNYNSSCFREVRFRVQGSNKIGNIVTTAASMLEYRLLIY